MPTEPKTDPTPASVDFESYHHRYDGGLEGDASLMGRSSRGSDIAINLVSGFDGTQGIQASLAKHTTSKACLFVNRLADIDLKARATLLAHSPAEIRLRYPAGMRTKPSRRQARGPGPRCQGQGRVVGRTPAGASRAGAHPDARAGRPGQQAAW